MRYNAYYKGGEQMAKVSKKKMKSDSFETIFLTAAWVIFIGSNRSIPSCIILICAGVMMIINALEGGDE
jgi:hypothetical protein